jgi:transcriptional antiterminator RfaH
VRTHPKHEHIAAAQLRHIPGVEVFNPQLRVQRLTRRGRVCTKESVFINYLFVRSVLEKTLDRVRYTPSVKGVVEFGQRVATVPDEVIDDLRQTLVENADTVFSDAPAEGEEAEIAEGPFQGERGIISRVLPARQRVEILLEVLGRSLPTEFSFSSIFFKRQGVAHRLLAGGSTCNRPSGSALAAVA